MNDYQITLDYTWIGGIVGWLVLAVTGGIAWGRVMERLKRHDEILGDHPEEVQTKNGCRAAVKECGGNERSAASFLKIDRIEKDIAEIKKELRERSADDTKNQIAIGAAISRLDTQLRGMMNDKRGVS